MAMAPPDMPSPMMVAMNGARTERPASMERAMASACAAFFGADAGIGAGRVGK